MSDQKDNEVIEAFIAYLMELEMRTGNSPDIRNYLTGIGLRIIDQKVTKGAEIKLPINGVITKFKQPTGIGRDKKVSQIKNAFQKQYLVNGKSALFDYEKIRQTIASMNSEDRAALMEFRTKLIQESPTLRVPPPQIRYDVPPMSQVEVDMDVDEMPEPDKEPDALTKEGIPDFRRRERLIEPGKLIKQLPQLIPPKDEQDPDLTEQRERYEKIINDIQSVRDNIQNRLNNRVPQDVKDPEPEREPINPEQQQRILDKIKNQPKMNINKPAPVEAPIEPSPDMVILPGDEKLIGSEVAQQPSITSALLETIYNKVVNALSPDLLGMFRRSNNNIRIMEEKVSTRAKSILKTLGYAGVLAATLWYYTGPLVTSFLFNWINDHLNQQAQLQEDENINITKPEEPQPVIKEDNKTLTEAVEEDEDDETMTDLGPEPEPSSEPSQRRRRRHLKPTAKSIVTPEGITVEPLVLTVAPDPQILKDTKKLEAYDPAEQENAIMIMDNDPADDLVVSREALFSFRRDMLGTINNNALLAANAERDIIRYSNMTLRPARGFIERENDINQFDQIWIDTPGRINDGSIAKFTPRPTVERLLKGYRGEPSITLPKAAFVEPDFKTRETRFFAPNTGDRNDVTAPFISPLRNFAEVTPLNVTKSRLFGQTEPFV